MNAPPATSEPGALDGLTILRFAHAFNSGGGVESYLADLNRAIGGRNTVKIIQVALTREAHSHAPQETTVGRSRLIEVRIPAAPNDPGLAAAEARSDRCTPRFRDRLLDRVLYTNTLNTLCARTAFRWRSVPRRALEAVGAGAKTTALLRQHRVELVLLHTSGGIDASEVIHSARRARVPVGLVHHFSNDRLGGVTVRQQVSSVHGLATVSGAGIPAYLRDRFHNVADCVDLDRFDPARTRTTGWSNPEPLIFAPGRLTVTKGQIDVVRVAARLRDRGLPVRVAFAGRMDSPQFERQLREVVAQTGMQDRVTFLGQLSADECRDWFGAATLCLMPTRHHEGLPRTLLESQAMKVPPIVFDVGGAREGLKHEKTGYTVPLGDLEAMTSAAARLIADPAQHKRMALAAREFMKAHFTVEAFASRHERFCLETIAAARSKTVVRSPR